MAREFITFTVKGVDKYQAHMKRLVDGYPNATVQGVTNATIRVLREVRKSAVSKLKRRTGKFHKSFKSEVTIKNMLAQGLVFSDHPGASIQEFGGTVKGKKGPMTIPLSNEAKGMKDRGVGRRGFGDRLVIKRSGSQAFLLEKLQTQTIFHYILKKSVRLKPTRYFTLGVDKGFEKSIEDFDKPIRALIKG